MHRDNYTFTMASYPTSLQSSHSGILYQCLELQSHSVPSGLRGGGGEFGTVLGHCIVVMFKFECKNII